MCLPLVCRRRQGGIGRAFWSWGRSWYGSGSCSRTSPAGPAAPVCSPLTHGSRSSGRSALCSTCSQSVHKDKHCFIYQLQTFHSFNPLLLLGILLLLFCSAVVWVDKKAKSSDMLYHLLHKLVHVITNWLQQPSWLPCVADWQDVKIQFLIVHKLIQIVGFPDILTIMDVHLHLLGWKQSKGSYKPWWRWLNQRPWESDAHGCGSGSWTPRPLAGNTERFALLSPAQHRNTSVSNDEFMEIKIYKKSPAQHRNTLISNTQFMRKKTINSWQDLVHVTKHSQ